MPSITRRARVGEMFKIVVPGVHTRYVFPQGTILEVARHSGTLGHEELIDVEVVAIEPTETKLLIKVPKGAEAVLVEED